MASKEPDPDVTSTGHHDRDVLSQPTGYAPSDVINPEEAEAHQQRLWDIIDDLKKRIQTKDVQEFMQKFVEDVKSACGMIYTTIKEANVLNVLKAIKDPCRLMLQPLCDTFENSLEDIMPDEEVPKGEDVTHHVEEIKPISEEVKDMIVALVDNTAAVCCHAAFAAECLSTLAKICTLEQLMLIMKCSVRPMVQVVAAPGFLEPPARPKRQKDLPDDPAEWVNLTLLPDIQVESLKKEPEYLPTRLLAGMVSYCIQNISETSALRHI